MKKLAGKGKMGRRDFIQLSMAAGFTLAASKELYVSAVRAEPKKGGSFRIGIGHGATTDSLDPANWDNSFTGDIGSGVIGNPLVEIDPSNNVVPALAESWESSPDAKKWVFNLRKGVEFHNGKTMTSKDVVASFNHHRGEDTKSAVKSALSSIKDIKADGDDKVVFELEAGSADFPYITSDYHLIIYPAKDDGKIAWEEGIGTGAFILERYDPGVSLKAKRNPNYWDEAYFDEIEMLTLADVMARTNALNSGDVHFIDRPDLKTLSLLSRNPNVEIDDVTGFAHYVAPMDVRAAPFNDVNVRLALKYCFKRDEIVKKVLFGHGTPGNDNPIAPVIKYATQPEPVHQYDPDKAKHHLKKAGLDSLSVDLSVADAAFAGAVDSALLMKEHAKACNIDINVIREAADGYWSNVWMKKPWCFSYWGGRPTVDWMMTTAYASGAAWNDTFWDNERFNKLLVEARAELDEKKRSVMYSEMQQILHDDGGIIVLMFNNFVTAHSKKVAHGNLNSNYDHDGGHIYRRWWFV
jgi:peptide/nickel transport system substrate-binding protein